MNNQQPEKEISFECVDCGWQSMTRPKKMKCPDCKSLRISQCEFKPPKAPLSNNSKVGESPYQYIDKLSHAYADASMQDVRYDNPNRDKIFNCAKVDFKCGFINGSDYKQDEITAVIQKEIAELEHIESKIINTNNTIKLEVLNKVLKLIKPWT